MNYTQQQLEFLTTRQPSDAQKEGGADIQRTLSFINSGTGSFTGCLSNLWLDHSNFADLAWFQDQNLEQFKYHCYVATKLRFIRTTLPDSGTTHKETYYYYALMSDHAPSAQWLAMPWFTDDIPKSCTNPKDINYRLYQLNLALGGHWTRLGERAEYFLDNVPERLKKLIPDMRFYLALAQGDKTGMQEALAQITDPKTFKRRKAHEADMLWFAAHFISPFASIYAKIAHRHGYELELDTPMIPKEWLPVAPLPEYPDPYDFMKKYMITL